MNKYPLIASVCGATMMLSGAASAQDSNSKETNALSDGYVKVGVIDDMSGTYKTVAGPGDALAAQMAIDDFGGSVLGQPIKLVSADHQNKAEVASSLARKWIDREGVDMITGMANSATGLAVQNVASSKNTITINTGSGTSELTESQCTKYGIHYGYDTHALSAGTAAAIVKDGGDSWFFLTADYVFGHSLQNDATNVIQSLDGKVLGSVAAPLSTSDFSSYLIQAQSSGAKVIGLANAGADTVNSIKQAQEFNITANQRLAGLLVFITDVKALGLETAQGLEFTTAFYRDRTDASREWSQQFFEKHGAMPTFVQAATYSAVLTYLKAVKEAGTDDADAVRKVLGEMTIDDMFVSDARIAANGQLRNDMYLMRVKTPDQSNGPWDLLDVVSTVPAKQAYVPLSESACPLIEQ